MSYKVPEAQVKHKTQLYPQHRSAPENSWSEARGKTGTEIPQRSSGKQMILNSLSDTAHTPKSHTDDWANATCSTRVQGLTGDCPKTRIDPFRLNLRACAMDWRTRFVGSRGNVPAGLLAERRAVFPWYY